MILDDGTLEHLEGLVGQFGTDGAAHVPVLHALVQMEHTDDAALLILGQCHQFFHDKRCLYGIVDVRHQILDTINDAEVWFDGPNGYIDHLAALLESKATQIKGEKR